MKTIHLTDIQATILDDYLRRALLELSSEIAGTDHFEYRNELKNERDVIRKLLVQLQHYEPKAA